jgi:hypothetical protein
LIRKGLEGGVDAAQLLQQQVRGCLSRLENGDADRYRIVVRIYANLKGLSKALALAGGQAGHEARSLAPFTSSFTRSQELFDFVDAGDKKDGADFKIKGDTSPLRFRIRLTMYRNLPSLRRKQPVQAHILCRLPRHWILIPPNAIQEQLGSYYSDQVCRIHQ